MKNMECVVARWLSAYNITSGYTDENFDFELDQFLHSASDDFLLDLIDKLSHQTLVNEAKSFLGASLAESLLLKDKNVVNKIIDLASGDPRLQDIFSYAWICKKMLPEAKDFLSNLHAKYSSERQDMIYPID